MHEKCKLVHITNEQEQKIDEMRAFFSMLFDEIDKLCSPSRETSLTITKLQEAQFWAIEAIVREKLED